MYFALYSWRWQIIFFWFLVNGIIPYSQLESPKLEKPPCSCLTCPGAAPAGPGAAGNPGNARSGSRLLPPWLWMWKSWERLWAPPLCDLQRTHLKQTHGKSREMPWRRGFPKEFQGRTGSHLGEQGLGLGLGLLRKSHGIEQYLSHLSSCCCFTECEFTEFWGFYRIRICSLLNALFSLGRTHPHPA